MPYPRNETLQQASRGSQTVNDTATYTGQFGGILVINESIIATINVTGGTDFHADASDLVGVSLPAGLWLPITFDSISLTSGVAYLVKDYK